MFTIAHYEFKMLLRNRLVALLAIGMPVVFSALMMLGIEKYGGAGSVAAMQVISVCGMGIYVAVTTALAARRQNNYLKKLRTTPVSKAAILAGVLAPFALINAIQLVAMVVILTIVAQPPAHPALVLLGLLGVQAFFIAFAFATTNFTQSPEHAQVTTMPLFFLAFGVAFWVVITGTEQYLSAKALLPGGGAASFLLFAWDGGDVVKALRMFIANLLWIVVAVKVARRNFSWEARK